MLVLDGYNVLEQTYCSGGDEDSIYIHSRRFHKTKSMTALRRATNAKDRSVGDGTRKDAA